MNDFVPTIPIELQIRKIIFENFNNVNSKFTNDQIFEILKKDNDLNPSWIIDDIELFFNQICKSGLVRNIAQNFTTIWLVLFGPVEKIYCDKCSQDVYLGTVEDKICPNPSCKSIIQKF